MKNERAAKIDVDFFTEVFKRMPSKASTSTTRVSSLQDCIGKRIKIIGFRSVTCTIKSVYGSRMKVFEMYTSDGERHNLLVNSVYSKNRLKKEIRAII